MHDEVHKVKRHYLGGEKRITRLNDRKLVGLLFFLILFKISYGEYKRLQYETARDLLEINHIAEFIREIHTSQMNIKIN